MVCRTLVWRVGSSVIIGLSHPFDDEDRLKLTLNPTASNAGQFTNGEKGVEANSVWLHLFPVKEIKRFCFKRGNCYDSYRHD